MLDTIALGYFSYFYLQHMSGMKPLLKIQYLTLPLFFLISANMVILGFTLNSCAQKIDITNLEKLVADSTESIL